MIRVWNFQSTRWPLGRERHWRLSSITSDKWVHRLCLHDETSSKNSDKVWGRVQVGELDGLGGHGSSGPMLLHPRISTPDLAFGCLWVLSFIIKLLWKVYAFLSFVSYWIAAGCTGRGGMRLSKFIIQPGRSGGKLGTPFAASIWNGSSLGRLSP